MFFLHYINKYAFCQVMVCFATPMIKNKPVYVFFDIFTFCIRFCRRFRHFVFFKHVLHGCIYTNVSFVHMGAPMLLSLKTVTKSKYEQVYLSIYSHNAASNRQVSTPFYVYVIFRVIFM